MDDKTLTMAQAAHLTEILTAIQRSNAGSSITVKWLYHTPNDDVRTGVLRGIRSAGGDYLRSDDDVRDGYVHISGTMEHFVPVRVVMDLIATNLFHIEWPVRS